MKKLLAFAMVVSLGLFCAVGCQPPKSDKAPADKQPAASATGGETKAATKTDGEAAKPAAAEKK